MDPHDRSVPLQQLHLHSCSVSSLRSATGKKHVRRTQRGLCVLFNKVNSSFKSPAEHRFDNYNEE